MSVSLIAEQLLKYGVRKLMKKLKRKGAILFSHSMVLAATWLVTGTAMAAENRPVSNGQWLAQLDAPVTNVFELRDVSPGDWAYEALRNLAERYQCLRADENGKFRGNDPITRFEFAVGLNDCLKQIESLVASTGRGGLSDGEIETITRLVENFQEELAILGARVDGLEARVESLENNQFSTTTKLVGEVAFNLAQLFDGPNGSAQAVLSNKVRLQLVTSFTGRDKLYTRLTSGNIGNSFADEIGSNEGRFAFDGPRDNNLTIDRLHYVLPVGDNLKIVTMASLGGHHFYANTFNPGLEAGGGANGALSRFAERNPIYRLGLGGQGLGVKFEPVKSIEFSAGYIAKGGNNPAQGAGLFNGNYSLLGQLVYKPMDRLQFGATYINGYDVSTSAFAFGGTGTNFANLGGMNFDTGISSNSYGLQAQWDINPKISLRAWGGYTNTKFIGIGSGDIWNYALALTFPDLGKEGSLGALIVGSEPYLGGLKTSESNKPSDFTNAVPWHIEASYKYKLSDNITLTPGLIWLTAPNQNSDNSSAIIGALRTTFSF